MEEKEKLDVNKDVNKDVEETATAAEGEADEAEKIDVCSDKFDPLLALYSPTVPLPFPNIKCFNNVAEYVSFQQGGRGRAKPENVEKKRLQKMKGVVDPERLERLQKLMVNNPVKESEEGEGSSSGQAPGMRKKQKTRKTVLTRMTSCKGSPLGELYRCVEERIRVKVHIRTFKGLRGVCSGFVVAFDKFWNMALVDVDETYREPLLGEALYHEKALTITRLFEKLKLQEKAAANEETARKQQQQQQQCSHLAGQRQPGKTESKLSDSVKARQDTHGAPLKARAPDNCPKGKKTDSQPYGKVHTRHVNQLFIRGENVILVNPQPL